jgi:acylglycerol lipase
MQTTATLMTTKGEPLFYRTWHAAVQRRGAMLLVHGLGEHSGRYQHVGEFLSQRGLTVYAHDHLGHGQSVGRRGWIASFGEFLDGVARMHALVVQESPGVPFVLLGHSMGGLIVAAYVVERRPQPDLLVLSGPAIVPMLDPSDRTIEPSRLSKDPEVQRAYMEDPLVLRERVTDELFARLADGVALLPGRAGEVRMPCLLIHGGDDALCSAEGAKMWVESSASTDLTVKIYPGGRHEMFNETNKQEVLTDLWEWLDRRLPAR